MKKEKCIIPIKSSLPGALAVVMGTAGENKESRAAVCTSDLKSSHSLSAGEAGVGVAPFCS